MECGSRFTFDFCDNPMCLGCTIESRDDISSPHLPTHDFVKIRAPILHHREIGKVLRDAKAGLERANSRLEEMEYRQRSDEFTKIYDDTQAGDGEERSGDGEERGDDVDDRDGHDGEDGEDSRRASPPEMTSSPVRQEVVASPDSESEDTVFALTCLKCKAPISRPCLYCVDCPGALSAISVPASLNG